MAETRRPIHIGIAVGVSASMYAVSLAAVAGLQHAQNAQVNAGYAPLAGAADQLDSANADLEARVEAARAAFDSSTMAFANLAGKVPGFENRLKTLANTVARLQGSSVGLSVPTGGAMPRVSGSKPVTVTTKPPVHTTTAPSGH